MDSLLVYLSVFGNTKKVAEAIAEVLESEGPVRVIGADQLTASHFPVDLVVMGSPTHRMSLPKEIRPVFDTLSKRILRGTPTAAFDTCYKMSAFLARFTAAKRLDRKLRKLGGKRVLPPESFYVLEREGPLYEGEIERARQWAGLILERLEAQGFLIQDAL